MQYTITLNGRSYEVEVELAEPMTMDSFRTYMPVGPNPAPVSAPTATTAPAAAASTITGAGETVTAPMPGSILKVNVVQGQAVKEGDVLCILEAMKMENEIMAPKTGAVSQVVTAKGSSVNTGDVLVVIS